MIPCWGCGFGFQAASGGCGSLKMVGRAQWLANLFSGCLLVCGFARFLFRFVLPQPFDGGGFFGGRAVLGIALVAAVSGALLGFADLVLAEVAVVAGHDALVALFLRALHGLGD